MGKWDEVLKDVPRLDEHDASKREKINSAKRAIMAETEYKANSAFLAHQYVAMRSAKEEIEAELSEAEIQLAAITELMDAQFDADGNTFLRLDNGKAVGVYTEPHAIVEDKEALKEWWHEQGLDNLLQVPWGTMNGLLKQRLENGAPKIPGVGYLKKVKVRLS